MKHILEYDNYLNEFTARQFLIHVSSSKHRKSIEKKGLIPQSIIKSVYFNKEHKEILYDLYKGKKVFATTFKDSIDVYDIKNIKQYVFPVPAIGIDNYEDYEEEAKDNIDFYAEVKKLDKRTDKMVGMAAHDLEMEFKNELSQLIVTRGKYDIWLIDNLIANAKWVEDPGGQSGDIVRGLEETDSVMTGSVIKPEALELIVASGKNLKFSYLEREKS